jgi:hypothetical protein
LNGQYLTYQPPPSRINRIRAHHRNPYWLNSMDSEFMENPWGIHITLTDKLFRSIHMRRYTLCETPRSRISHALSHAVNNGFTRSFTLPIRIPMGFHWFSTDSSCPLHGFIMYCDSMKFSQYGFWRWPLFCGRRERGLIIYIVTIQSLYWLFIYWLLTIYLTDQVIHLTDQVIHLTDHLLYSRF